MNNYTKKYSQLAGIIDKVDLIYFDTCSLIEPNIDNFLTTIFGLMNNVPQKQEVLILQKVRDELENNSRNPNKSEVERKNAKKGLDLVFKYEQMHYMVRYGSAIDPFADAALQSELTNRRLSKRILLISEDKKLMGALELLNSAVQQRTQRGYPILFFSIREGVINSVQGSGQVNIPNNKNNQNGYVAHNNVNRPNTVKFGQNGNPNFYGNNRQNNNGNYIRTGQNQRQQNNKPNNNNYLRNDPYDKSQRQTTQVQRKPKVVSRPNSSAAIDFGNGRLLSVTIERGDGKFESGLIKKVSKVGFKLIINYITSDNTKLISVKGRVKGKNGTFVEIDLIDGENKVEVELSKIEYPFVEVTVSAKISLGFLHTKTESATVGRQL